MSVIPLEVDADMINKKTNMNICYSIVSPPQLKQEPPHSI